MANFFSRLFGGSAQPVLDENTIIIDVRSATEYRSGHLEGARNFDVNANFEGKLGGLKKDGHYLLYCQSGARSSQAASRMRARGFTNVTNAGGIHKASRKTGLDIQ